MKINKGEQFLLLLFIICLNSCTTEIGKAKESLSNYRFSQIKIYTELEKEKYNMFELFRDKNEMDSSATILLKFINSIKFKVTGLENISADSLWTLGEKLDEELMRPNEIFDDKFNGLGLQLEKGLREYYEAKLVQAGNNEELKKVIENRIPQDMVFNGNLVFWIAQNFVHIPRVGILCNLSTLQLEIINTEYQLLNINNAR